MKGFPPRSKGRHAFRRVRPTDNDDGCIAPARIDLHLDGEGFNAVDGGGQDTGQHRPIVSEGGRKGNAVFATLGE